MPHAHLIDPCSFCPEAEGVADASWAVEYTGRYHYPDTRDERRDLACQKCLGEAIAYAWAMYDGFTPPQVLPLLHHEVAAS